jgi:signal transduction histidine kinase
MIQEIQDELRFSKQAEGIRFINEIPQDLHIEADKMRLRIIFSNLISNAIKYHDPSKNDRFVRISVNKQPLHLEIAVQDNGIGIDTVHHHKVFESYYTVSNRSDSNGLGLSNVKDSVQKMGGSIQLESVPHVGSIFRVTIPSVKTKK